MKNILLLIVLLSFFTSCNPDNSEREQEQELGNNEEWLIPEDEVFDGGPGKDGIPSIDEPVFIHELEVDFLDEEDLVVVVAMDDEIKVYPHAILNWHEIVNDNIGDHYFSLTYCPLTGTAINWNRVVRGELTEFGVSGLLYNSNLIPYDRSTGSNWSQMRLDCVNGALKGQTASVFQVFESTWETVKKLDDISVLSTNTGFSRSYRSYPYGDYLTNNDFLLFPVSNEDNRLPQKDRVLGIIGRDIVKAYSFDNIKSENSEEIILDMIDGKQVAIIGNKNMNFLNAYQLEDGRSYSLLRNQFPNILQDDLSNIYDVFGRVISGPNIGNKLSQPNSYLGFWFAWATFYPEILLYE